jgi:ATP-dependent exoDNAse (exonuclease V) beta subunit
VAPGSGAVFGRLVHAALERFAPGDGAHAAELVALAAADVQRALAREGVRLEPAILDSAARLLQRIAVDPAILAVWDARRVSREVPFVIPHGDDVVSGTFDVLLENPDGALSIVDWKTESIGDEPGDIAKNRFREQAAVYAWAAAEACSDRPVREVRIVFLSAHPVRTGAFAVGPALLAEARSRLDASSRPADLATTP